MANTTKTPSERALHTFRTDCAGHQMEIRHDDGLYRHVSFRKPGTGILETGGVEHWEKLKGQQAVVLFAAGKSDWGARPVGIAGVSNGKVLVFDKHVEEFTGLDS